MEERNYENEYWEAQEHINLLEGERRELVEYAFHKGDCSSMWTYFGKPQPCTCGYEALLTESDDNPQREGSLIVIGAGIGESADSVPVGYSGAECEEYLFEVV